MKVTAVIQARMGSKRLRGKSLMAVGDKPLLYRVVESVRQFPFIDDIIVATTDQSIDDPIASAMESLGVQVHRGASLDVLKRFYDATLNLDEQDTIVRFTADNPIYNISIAQKVFDIHMAAGNDYTHIDGLSHIVPELIAVRALRDQYKRNTSQFDKEHVTPYIRKNKDLFKTQTLAPTYEGLRADLDQYLTVDTLEELNRFETMLADLGIDAKDTLDFDEIYGWLDGHCVPQPDEDKGLRIDLAGIPVGDGYPAFIIAEIGQNHNGEVTLAKKLIDMAVDCGANAVKFQKRDIPSELSKEAYNKPYDNPNSFGETYGEHRIFLELNEEEHLELKEYAQAKGIIYFCTPCDVPSVEMMERIGCPFYKVASRDLTNIPLLERLAIANKKVIISTGMATHEDIVDALRALQATPEKVIIMQCTSEYPCKLENVNLKAINTLRETYGLITGLSDHTSGVIISAVSTVMGADIIEKHVTLDRTMKGTDQPGSLEKSGLSKLVEYIRASELAIGDGKKLFNPAVESAKNKLARSITSKVDIPKGTTLTEEMLCLKSPGTGLLWRERDQLLGKTTNQDIEADVTLEASFFE